ncbi:Kinesin-like protein KIN-4A [Nymphon striatum]|nr:Kinesin-like protein KIN-4A [Nymphon striatum]
MATDISVRVCLRCRPLIPKELNDGCQVCLNFTSNNSQVILGKDKAFTYDSAYSPETPQIEVYRKSVSPMIQSLFKGYNVTVLAYGQTGSGKTHTMGTSHSLISNEKEMGVIPRAMQDLFKGIREREDKYAFIIKASFLEIYKEELHDLLRSTVERNKDAVAIRENFNGNLKGLIEEVVSSPDDVLAILCKGSLARSTGSTAMNSQSSRSHAIFTINIEQTEKSDTSININKGLLALGNVINALCDKNNHIPYRDSKLTRLLQDSLGGNSHTLMIACVSPADYNFEETLNTLRYADRARKIKNKPVINRDPQTIEIMRLKQLVILSVFSTVEAMKNSAIDPDNVEAQNKLRMLEDIQNSIIQLQEEQKIDHSKVLDDSVGSPEKNAPDMDLSPEEEANRTEHTLRQAEMQRQLQILNEALNKKEELAEKMSENSCQFETMKDHYEEALKNMENEICSLQKERDDLSTNLKTTQSNPAAVKISEQRRKRLQELENKISDLKKKVVDQERMLKLKEQSENKVKVLANDIQTMKQQRVKLMKQMKVGTKQFNQWKTEKEREVTQLKQKDRKRQVELVKMEKTHSKQQNVLKRKIEQAVFHNKRLKDAMERHRLVSQERERKQNVNSDGIKDRIEQWLKQELELAFRRSSSDIERTPVQNENLVNKIEELKKEIKLRTQQISDLQQEVLDAELEENVNKRWDGVRSMLESKCALKWLFNQIVQSRVNIFELNTKQSDSQNNYDEVLKRIEILENELKVERASHENDVINIQKEYEEKVLYLMRQLPTNFDSSSVCDSSLTRKNQIPRQRDIPSWFSKKKTGKNHVKYEDIEDDEEDVDLPDSGDDPDWKYTPFEKRKLVKESEIDGGCHCKTSTCKKCSCHKAGRSCNLSCKCDPLTCLNQSTSENEDFNGTFNVPKKWQLQEKDENEVLRNENRQIPRNKSKTALNKINNKSTLLPQLDGSHDDIDSSGILKFKLGSKKK